MSTILILSNRGDLTKEDEHLVYTDYHGKRTRILPFKTEHLLIAGNVTITGDAMKMILKNELPVTYLTQGGMFLGRIVYQDGKNVFLRQKQFLLLENKKKVLEIAKSIVAGKIKNQLSFVQRIKRSRGSKEEFEASVKSIKQALKEVSKCTSLTSLRGIEGNAARHYFAAYNCNFLAEWAEFGKRTQNPPQTNVNAVLSFLYTLTCHYVTTAIESQGLDTMAGNLHELNYGRDVLTFDLMEEFRVPMADTLTCHLFNKNILEKKDFHTISFSSESKKLPVSTIEQFHQGEDDENEGKPVEAIYLNETGIKKVFEAFIEKVNSEVLYVPAKKRLSFAEIMVEQAKMYKRVILGEEADYTPFYYR